MTVRDSPTVGLEESVLIAMVVGFGISEDSLSMARSLVTKPS
jgi:hypothetical protein